MTHPSVRVLQLANSGGPTNGNGGFHRLSLKHSVLIETINKIKSICVSARIASRAGRFSSKALSAMLGGDYQTAASFYLRAHSGFIRADTLRPRRAYQNEARHNLQLAATCYEYAAREVRDEEARSEHKPGGSNYVLRERIIDLLRSAAYCRRRLGDPKTAHMHEKTIDLLMPGLPPAQLVIDT